jgi:hypothetical protein
MALMLFFRREYARAEATIRTTLELGAANPLTLWVGGMIGALQGKFEAPIASCQRTAEVYGSAPLIVAYLGMLYGMAGRGHDAKRADGQALEVMEVAFGGEHPTVVAPMLTSLANQFRSTQRPADAERFYLCVIAIKERAL